MTGSHGQPLDEAMSDRANPADPSGTYVYVAEGPETDYAEQALLDAQDRWKKAHEGQSMNGLHWAVRRIERSDIPPLL